MTALLLTTLFVTAALLAGGVLLHSFNGTLAEAAQARAALAACPQSVAVDYRVSEVRVSRSSAKVLSLPIKPKMWRLVQPELRAAA